MLNLVSSPPGRVTWACPRVRTRRPRCGGSRRTRRTVTGHRCSRRYPGRLSPLDVQVSYPTLTATSPPGPESCVGAVMWQCVRPTTARRSGTEADRHHAEEVGTGARVEDEPVDLLQRGVFDPGLRRGVHPVHGGGGQCLPGRVERGEDESRLALHPRRDVLFALPAVDRVQPLRQRATRRQG